MIKELIMNFAWQSFKAWMRRLKLCKTSYLSCNMAKKIEENFKLSFYFWFII